MTSAQPVVLESWFHRRCRGASNELAAGTFACAKGAKTAHHIGGTDGGAGSPEDPAGAFIDDITLARARRVGLDPVRYLDDNNSTEFFEKLADLLVPGPTLTNVNDFRAVLVDSP